MFGPPIGTAGRARHVLAVGMVRIAPLRPARRRDARVGAVRDEQPHRVDVGGVRRAPERRRARLVDVRLIEVVARVPDLPVDPRVRVRALVEQRAHQVEIRVPLLQVRARLRVGGLRRPLRRSPRRRAASCRPRSPGSDRRRASSRYIAEIELAVDRRDEERRRAVGRADGVDVRAAVDERLGPTRDSPGARRSAARSGRPARRSARCSGTAG